MRGLLTLVLIACFVPPACAQDVEPSVAPTGPAAEPAAGPPPAVVPAAPEGGDEAKSEGVRAAEKLIAEMVQAYRAAPAFTDRIQAEYKMRGMENEPPTEYLVRFDANNNVHLLIPPYEVVALDGNLYMTARTVQDRVIRVDVIDNDILKTMHERFGGRGTMSVQYALRCGKPLDEILSTMKLDVPEVPRLSSYRVITDNDGRSFEQITLISGIGHVVFNVDPETKLIAFAETEYEPPGAPGGFKMKRHWRFHPEVHEELPEPITFEPGDRKFVQTVRQLYRLGPTTLQPAKLKVKEGQPAPDFTLYTLEGEKVSLSDFRGSVVVLELWATWCVPCVRALPLVQQFAEWARSSGKPIEVYGLNVMERGDTPGEKWENALEYWDREDLTLPSLFDPGQEVVDSYGIDSLPVTIIVDPLGRMYKAHAGFDPNMDLVAKLRADAEAALKKGGAGAK